MIHQLEYYRLVLDEGKNIARVGAERGAEKRYS